MIAFTTHHRHCRKDRDICGKGSWPVTARLVIHSQRATIIFSVRMLTNHVLVKHISLAGLGIQYASAPYVLSQSSWSMAARDTLDDTLTRSTYLSRRQVFTTRFRQ